MATKIQLRGDTAANWTSVNPTLASREAAVETDTKLLKIGDGVNTWANLSYFPASLVGTLVAGLEETVTINAGGASGTLNYDLLTQSVYYYTGNASANMTVNFRGSSSKTLNSQLSTGQSITAVLLVTNGATAYYPSTIQVDGVAQTVKWQGGTAPTAGSASAIDAYTFVMVKTAASTYTVLGSVAKFA